MKIDITAILIPLLSSCIIGSIFIIVSISRDKFLKTIDINQMFAITKILKFILFIIISTCLIVLISLDLVHHEPEQINNVLNNPKEILTYFTKISLFIIIFSAIYIFLSSFSNKDCYYIENYNNSGKRLYILQKYKDYYICTIDSPKSDIRIIKNSEDIINTKLEYYYNSNIQHFDVSNVFTYKSHKTRMFTFFLSNFLLIILSIFLIGAILLLNSFINFQSQTLIIISLTFSIAILVYLFIALKMNWSKLRKYLNSRKE